MKHEQIYTRTNHSVQKKNSRNRNKKKSKQTKTEQTNKKFFEINRSLLQVQLHIFTFSYTFHLLHNPQCSKKNSNGRNNKKKRNKNKQIKSFLKWIDIGQCFIKYAFPSQIKCFVNFFWVYLVSCSC